MWKLPGFIQKWRRTDDVDHEFEAEEGEELDAQDRFGLAQAGRVFLYASLAVASVVALGWAVRTDAWGQLHDGIARRHWQRIDTSEIVFACEVVKVEGVEAELLARAHQAARKNPFDRSSLAAIREILVQSRWMEESSIQVRRDQVTEKIDGERRRIDRIVIDGQFRVPFALIRRGQTEYLVDGSGTRLPVDYETGRVRALPVIANASGPVPAVGEMWRGGDLTDGLLLARFLRAQKRSWYDQVEAIDVANWDGRDRNKPRLVLITNRGYRIGWGRAVGDEAGIEHPAAEKIRALDAYYLSHGGVIGSPQGMLTVNQPLLTQDRSVRMAGGAAQAVPSIEAHHD